MAHRELPASTRLAMRMALLAAIAWPLVGSAQASIPKEQIKAALVFNFLKFTEWPSESGNGP